MNCNCWRIVGEYLRCAEHGGGDIWDARAYRQPERILDAPTEPINLNDPWFDFLNRGEKVLEEVTP